MYLPPAAAATCACHDPNRQPTGSIPKMRAENVLEVLVYLFENYMVEEESSAANEDEVREELEAMGFASGDIDKALRWLDELARHQSGSVTPPREKFPSLRHYTPAEARCIDAECQSFLHYLEQNGVLDSVSRELVIDRVMALNQDNTLEQIKWVVLLVLLNQPGHEAAFAWMHELVYEPSAGYLH